MSELVKTIIKERYVKHKQSKRKEIGNFEKESVQDLNTQRKKGQKELENSGDICWHKKKRDLRIIQSLQSQAKHS